MVGSQTQLSLSQGRSVTVTACDGSPQQLTPQLKQQETQSHHTRLLSNQHSSNGAPNAPEFHQTELRQNSTLAATHKGSSLGSFVLLNSRLSSLTNIQEDAHVVDYGQIGGDHNSVPGPVSGFDRNNSCPAGLSPTKCSGVVGAVLPSQLDEDLYGKVEPAQLSPSQKPASELDSSLFQSKDSLRSELGEAVFSLGDPLSARFGE